MHKEILTAPQVALLPFIEKFNDNFYLAGGTSLALQIGHRRSIDFDLFTKADPLNKGKIKSAFMKLSGTGKSVIYEAFDQIHFFVNGVKITFFTYPFDITTDVSFEDICRMPDIVTLGAMKTFALGGRNKWKDYVDLYFILRDHCTLEMLIKKAEEIFKESFNPKLFRGQLSFFDDIDYSEAVEFIGTEISLDEVKKFLTDVATTEI
jgi:hypothetical protein